MTNERKNLVRIIADHVSDALRRETSLTDEELSRFRDTSLKASVEEAIDTDDRRKQNISSGV